MVNRVARTIENSDKVKVKTHHKPQTIITINDAHDESIVETDDDKKSKALSVRKSKEYQRTTQEWSYFDWSKVKLYQNKYKDEEKSTVYNIQSIDENGIENNENLIKFNNANNELPQVITIRFQ